MSSTEVSLRSEFDGSTEVCFVSESVSSQPITVAPNNAKLVLQSGDSLSGVQLSGAEKITTASADLDCYIHRHNSAGRHVASMHVNGGAASRRFQWWLAGLGAKDEPGTSFLLPLS